MFRGKRGPSRAEAAGIHGIRTRSLKSEFHRFSRNDAVHRCFACQEAGFAAVRIVRRAPEQEECRPAAGQGRHSEGAETAAVGHGSTSKMPHDRLVRSHQEERTNSPGCKPAIVLGRQMQWARPNRFLIQEKTLLQARYAKGAALAGHFPSRAFLRFKREGLAESVSSPDLGLDSTPVGSALELAFRSES